MARRNISQHVFKQFLAQRISDRRAQSLAKSDATQWVRATAAQLGERGLAKSTERYVPTGTKRITDKTPFLSKRQFQKKQTGLSLERRAALIRSGERVSEIGKFRPAAEQSGSRNRVVGPPDCHGLRLGARKVSLALSLENPWGRVAAGFGNCRKVLTNLPRCSTLK